MSNIGMRLTRKGKGVLARGLTGENIHFSCVKIGSGEFDYETEAVYELEGLRRYEMTLPITACEVKGDGTVYVEAYLTNAEVVEGFACTEHGLYALDENGNEVLYAYRNVGTEYDFIPSFSGTAFKNLYLEYICEIQDAENITATLDLSVAYVGREDFKTHIDSPHPHLNTPNHYLDVDEADAIWATDNDSHLHKLALKDLKGLLADKANLSPSRDELFLKAKQDLGLEANVIMYEDFEGEETYDALKVKVTSSAIGGKLIGLESYEGVRAGGVYTISDGIFREPVTIKAVRKNAGGTHAELVRGLDFSYDNNATFLLRSFDKGSEQLNVTFNPVGFAGYEANVERRIEMSRYEQDYTFKGGALTADGYLTLE